MKPDHLQLVRQYCSGCSIVYLFGMLSSSSCLPAQMQKRLEFHLDLMDLILITVSCSMNPSRSSRLIFPNMMVLRAFFLRCRECTRRINGQNMQLRLKQLRLGDYSCWLYNISIYLWHLRMLTSSKCQGNAVAGRAEFWQAEVDCHHTANNFHQKKGSYGCSVGIQVDLAFAKF